MVACGDAEPLAEAKACRQCSTMTHTPNEPDDDGGGSRRGALIGLVVTALLVVAGYYLMTVLREQGKVEDCLMSGRSNCAPLDIPTHK
jgi:hypothetical protein